MPWPRSTSTAPCSAAGSSWLPATSAAGSTSTSPYPLPPPVAALRSALYPPLAAIANRWNAALRIESRYPPDHPSYLERCHRAGQTRPTPLMLRYGAGDYNRLHQDLYGEHVFPMQAAILLSAPGRDFTGGEFVMTEQRPRMQPRAEVAPLAQGDAVIFPVRHRPVEGARGFHRAHLRHGVSRLRAGRRFTLGIIFHDAPLSPRSARSGHDDDALLRAAVRGAGEALGQILDSPDRRPPTVVYGAEVPIREKSCAARRRPAPASSPSSGLRMVETLRASAPTDPRASIHNFSRRVAADMPLRCIPATTIATLFLPEGSVSDFGIPPAGIGQLVR